MSPLNIVVVAEEAAGVHALRLLAGRGQPPLAALTSSPDDARGTSVASAAGQLGVPVGPAAAVADPAFAEHLRSRRVDLVLNVHSLHIADSAVLEAPAIGSFNLHPGPLPEYAGLSAPSWAVFRGERSHGVTLHWMEPEVDAGPIAYAAGYELGPRDTGLSVSVSAVRHGLPLIGRVLDAAMQDPATIPRLAQDPARRRWHRRGPPYAGRLPWRLPASRIEGLVRASDYRPLPSPWGFPRARCAEQDLEVVDATATGRPTSAPAGTVAEIDGEVGIAAADEWVSIRRLRTDTATVPAGCALRPGDRLDPGPEPVPDGDDAAAAEHE